MKKQNSPSVLACLIIGLGATLGNTTAGIVSVVEQNVEPDVPAIIEPTSDDPEAVGITFDEDARSYAERIVKHQFNGAAFNENSGRPDKESKAFISLPDYLIGNEYVRFAQGARDNADYSATITTDEPSIFYLLIDNRLDGPAGNSSKSNQTDPVLGGTLQWVLDDIWVRVNTGISPNDQADYIGLDESGNGTGPGVGLNQFMSVYRYGAPATSVTVRNNGMDGGAMISVVVAPAPAGTDPISFFGPQTSPIKFGEGTELRWTISTDASSASIDQGIGNVLDITSQEDGTGAVSVSPVVDTTYTMEVVGDDTATAETTVEVGLISSFTAGLDFVDAGDPVTLSFEVRPDAEISISNAAGAAANAQGLGTVIANPEETTTYVLTATGSGRTETSEVTVVALPSVFRFVLLDFGATDGQPEPGANGGQIGGGPVNTNGAVLPPTVVMADSGREFSVAVDVTNPSGVETGRLDWTTRGTPPVEPLAAVASDLMKNNDGMIRVILSNLPAGRYELTSYHIDPVFSQCEEIKILVTDDDGTARDTGVVGSAFLDPVLTLPELTTDIVNEHAFTFSVASNGIDDVIVYFDGTGAVDREVPLNGLLIVPPAEEKNTFALLDIGATDGQLESGATGDEQIGAGGNNANGPDLAPITLTADNGSIFTMALDALDPAGSVVGRIDWRDRGDAEGLPLYKLAEDFTKNNGGMLRVVLGGLPEGEYDLTSYHIDPVNSQCEAIKVLVTDIDGEARDTGAVGSAFFADNSFPNIEGLTTAIIEEHSTTFSIKSNGTDDVIIYFDGRSATDKEVPLNGLAISGGGVAAEAIVSFLAVPNTVNFGETSTLRWVVDSGVTALSIEPGIGDVLAMTTDGAGSVEITPAADTTYTLSYEGAGGPATGEANVTVKLVSAFASDQSFLLPGETTTLTWTIRPDATASILPGIGDVTASTSDQGVGSVDVKPIENTTYTISVTGGGETLEQMVTVTVAPEPSGELFALLDIGAIDGFPEPGAAEGRQIGAAGTNSDDIPLEAEPVVSNTGETFLVSIDSIDPEGNAVGTIDWRDRGFTNEEEPLTALAADLAENGLGMIRVTLSDLPAGAYNAISYHVDAAFSQSEAIKVLVTDAVGTAVDTGAVATSYFGTGNKGPDAENLTNREVRERSAGFSFVSNGVDDVIIYFDGTDAIDDEVPLSGIMLLRETGDSNFVIKSITRDPATGDVTLVWDAAIGITYGVDAVRDLGDEWLELSDGIDSDSAEASFVDKTVPAGDTQRYYRITIVN